MRPGRVAGLGELWLAGLVRPVWRPIFRYVGLADAHAVSNTELDAHLALLKLGDRGRASRRIMRGFELTEAKQRFLYAGLADRGYPAQIIWGRLHFLQEDEVADAIIRPVVSTR